NIFIIFIAFILFFRFRGTSVVPKANFQATVDKSDVARHSKLAEEWWDPLGPMKGLHSMNDLRIALIRNGLINEGKLSTECLKSPLSLKGIKILDVGCGGGILSIPLSRIGANVTGIDPSEELIEIAKSKASEDGTITDRIHFTRTTIEEYSETNKEVYDAVVLSEVVEHVNSKYEFLKYSNEILQPGGSIFITTINKTFASWSLAICTAEYLLGLLPKGTHEWSKFISPNELTSYLECGKGIIYFIIDFIIDFSR
ncbi:hypothetical protein AAG570_011528, partial [Ranatra chinensis]